MTIGASFEVLLDAAQDGDERAFAALWRQLNPAVLRYLSVVSGLSAEDLASETWLEVVRGLRRFRGEEAAFRSWVFTIARHRAVDQHRRDARRPVSPVPVETLLDHPAVDDPAASVLEMVSTRAALALIAELPADQAEVVALRVVGNLDVAAVSRIVGKRPGTVRVLAHRGLRRLAERLSQPRTREGV